MSARLPAAVTFSLEALARHSGGDKPSRDGWGVAFYDGADACILRQPNAAYGNPMVSFIETNGPHSKLVISHIRDASTGTICLANTHPFSRPLGGRLHSFAHNGSVVNIFDRPEFLGGEHRPLGETDSEYAFCSLLSKLEPLWSGKNSPTPTARRDCVEAFAHSLKKFGPANFLYSDSEYLYAFSDRRRQNDGRFKAPGLHILSRHCDGPSGRTQVDGVNVSGQVQSVLLIASVPLNDEAWQPLTEGELLMVRHGEVIEADTIDAQK